MNIYTYDPVIEFWPSVAALMENVRQEEHEILHLASSSLINAFPFELADFFFKEQLLA